MNGYHAITVTLTSGSTTYQLLDLLRAVDSTVSGQPKQVSIEASRNNATGSYVSIGDASLSATRMGCELGPSDVRTYADADGFRLGLLYVRGSTDGLTLNVEVHQ